MPDGMCESKMRDPAPPKSGRCKYRLHCTYGVLSRGYRNSALTVRYDNCIRAMKLRTGVFFESPRVPPYLLKEELPRESVRITPRCPLTP